MDRVLRVSASTGSMAATAGEGEELGRWAYVGGPRSHGRFARHSIRNGTSSQEAMRPGTDETSTPTETIQTMVDDGQLAVEVDVQVMQLTLKASHPQALPDDVAKLPDVTTVFGEVSMQGA